jgi:hypothetical protein
LVSVLCPSSGIPKGTQPSPTRSVMVEVKVSVEKVCRYDYFHEVPHSDAK